MRDFSDDLADLRRRLDEARAYLRIDELRARLPQLETEAGRPDLWDDQERAKQVNAELAATTDDLGTYDGLAGRIEDAETLVEMAREEGDESLEPEIAEAIARMAADFERIELRSLFSGEYDEHDAICELHSGEGGADASDWANMLLRMYLRWAEQHGFDVEMDAVTEGSEAGISSATFIVKGRYAYGWLKSEHGVHRLVRISPFNAQGKRQTAFAALEVIPMLDEAETDVEIDDKELRIDVYRSSGAGGQHVNVTDSAVRITHLPTGIVVSCQNERSQHQNKDRAMAMLKAKLADLERQKREDELASIRGEQRSVGFGSQIRSYVMQPYQMVKDLRSDHEVGQVEGVLDGDLDRFMEAYLRWVRAEQLEG
ncbi:MAG TPA: peptide chain release factor 2 [Acidimicrobiales bacterium]|nr:peptide chain release factor 2 [Acidimicrobiales bacterium]